jgi:signal peptidase I
MVRTLLVCIASSPQQLRSSLEEGQMPHEQAQVGQDGDLPPSDSVDSMPAPRLRRRGRTVLIGALVTMVLLCVILTGVRSTFGLYRQGGDGMLPALANRDLLLVNRRDRDPARGEIVVFDPPILGQAIFIKRVVALPGDTVSIRDGQLRVNGVVIEEPYVQARTTYRYPLGDKESTTIPAGAIFVLGDNRNNSADSHAFGPVALTSVKGTLIAARSATGSWTRHP